MGQPNKENILGGVGKKKKKSLINERRTQCSAECSCGLTWFERLKAESFPGPTRRRLTVGNVQNATSGGWWMADSVKQGEVTVLCSGRVWKQ